jgi:hypothetical protein
VHELASFVDLRDRLGHIWVCIIVLRPGSIATIEPEAGDGDAAAVFGDICYAPISRPCNLAEEYQRRTREGFLLKHTRCTRLTGAHRHVQPIQEEEEPAQVDLGGLVAGH